MRNKSEYRRNIQENRRQKKEKKNVEVYPLMEWKEKHKSIFSVMMDTQEKPRPTQETTTI